MSTQTVVLDFAFKEGYNNGYLCAKDAKMADEKPNNGEWSNAVPSCVSGLDHDYDELEEQFIKGCEAGWKQAFLDRPLTAEECDPRS